VSQPDLVCNTARPRNAWLSYSRCIPEQWAETLRLEHSTGMGAPQSLRLLGQPGFNLFDFSRRQFRRSASAWGFTGLPWRAEDALGRLTLDRLIEGTLLPWCRQRGGISWGGCLLLAQIPGADLQRSGHRSRARRFDSFWGYQVEVAWPRTFRPTKVGRPIRCSILPIRVPPNYPHCTASSRMKQAPT
jgi:hypothetical protein